jgi:hypothetical protein
MIRDRILIHRLGGVRPVEGDGWVAGECFEFRAKGARWGIVVGDWGAPVWRHEEDYGDGRDAGSMSRDEAEALVRRECARFIAEGNVAGLETPSWRELEMGRFGSGVHGPLLAVSLEGLRDGWARYHASLDEERILNLVVTYDAPTAIQRVDAPGLARVERWTLNDRGGDLWKDDALQLAIRRELEASAARLGLAVLTEIAMEEA